MIFSSKNIENCRVPYCPFSNTERFWHLMFENQELEFCNHHELLG